MAKTQQPGIGSITVWMIIFVALWLTSTVFLVVLYTGQEELNSELERYRAENNRLISPSEKNSVELSRSARAGGPTVVGLLEGARLNATLFATGEEADDVEAIRRKRDQLAERIAGDRIAPDADDYADASLLEGMTRLYEAYKADNALRRAADERVNQLDAEVAKLTETNAGQKNDFDARVKELDDRFAQVEADRAAYGAQRDRAVAQLEREFEDRRAQTDADLTKARQRIAGLARDLAELRTRFVGQQERFGELLVGPAELSTARRPDGRILTAIPGDEVVYVDLGRDDHLTLGLQFSVYSSDTGIPANGRGKAQIEVVSISPASAECKVLHVAENELVMEGDLVANPVYDPDRALTFLVVGRFDLDHNGEFDADGRAVMEAMVKEWGGVITNELTALTDFLIVGGAPRLPGTARDLSPEQRRRNDAMQAAFDRYTDTLASASSLSVPVMSQDVFLDFLGYTSRITRR